MSGAERIVIAFGSLGETGQTAARAQCADPITTAGQNLVRIGLMPDIPDQPIARGVEDVMQRRRQFHDAQSGSEMATGNRNRIDGFLTKLVGNLPNLVHLQPAQVVWCPNGVEKRRLAKYGHSHVPILPVGTSFRRKLVAQSPAQRKPRRRTHLSRPKPDL